MSDAIINAICRQVAQRFPEMKGVHPKVTRQTDDQMLLVFSGSATTSNGKTISRTVRVVANSHGKIQKMTTSR